MSSKKIYFDGYYIAMHPQATAIEKTVHTSSGFTKVCNRIKATNLKYQGRVK